MRSRTSTGMLIVGIIVLAIIILFGLYFFFRPPAQNAPASQAATTTAPTYTHVQVALLDTSGTGSGPTRGCDTVVMVSREVPPTQAPLTAALETLFSLSSTTVDGWYNFIAKTNDTLAFDHASVQNGVASIYLTGSLSGLAGICDDPRAAAQIDETALQFPTVSSVQLYLNGSPTELTPSEKGT